MSLQVHIAHLCEMMNVTQSSMTPNVLNFISLKLTDFTNALPQENDNDSDFHQKITTNKTTENLTWSHDPNWRIWRHRSYQFAEWCKQWICCSVFPVFEGVKPWRYLSTWGIVEARMLTHRVLPLWVYLGVTLHLLSVTGEWEVYTISFQPPTLEVNERYSQEHATMMKISLLNCYTMPGAPNQAFCQPMV